METPAGFSLSNLHISAFTLSLYFDLSHFLVYSVGQADSKSPPDSYFSFFLTVFCLSYPHLLFFLLLSPSIPGTHAHRGSAAVIIAGWECRADHWTVFVQNASICQTWLIELRPQPETAHSSEQSSTESSSGLTAETHTPSHTHIHTLLCMLRHIQCILLHAYICTLTGVIRYILQKKNYLTWAIRRHQAEWKADRHKRRRVEEKDKMSHERVCATHINFRVSW